MVKTTFIEETLEIPTGVTITVDDNNRVTVKGPKGGPITKDFSHAQGIKITIKGKNINFSAHFPRNKTVALVKTISSIINNLIIGVQTNFQYVCKVCYSHFPCNVEVKKGEIHVVNFLGERAPRKTKFDDVNVKVKIDGDDVYLIGPDKESLGQTAANIKQACRIRKKDPRVFQDGVYLYKRMQGNEVLWEII
jgi:large subunit ribosomal protein L6